MIWHVRKSGKRRRSLWVETVGNEVVRIGRKRDKLREYTAPHKNDVLARKLPILAETGRFSLRRFPR